MGRVPDLTSQQKETTNEMVLMGSRMQVSGMMGGVMGMILVV